jgi:hypothetical protein
MSNLLPILGIITAVGYGLLTMGRSSASSSNSTKGGRRKK